jgi:hypothetical protein
LQTKRKARKESVREEQLRLLREILVELQRLNDNVAAGKAGRRLAIESGRPTNDSSGDEEFEEYE